MSLLPRRWISGEIKEEGVVGQIEKKVEEVEEERREGGW